MDNKSKKPTKGLQKFTNKITIEKIQELIDVDDQKTIKKFKDILYKRINVSIAEMISPDKTFKEREIIAEKFDKEEQMICMILECSKTKDESKTIERLRRITYDINRNLIINQIAKLVSEGCRFPNQTEIASFTGLSRQTIIKHMNDLSADREYSELRQSSATLLPSVMAKLYRLGMNGDVKAMKTFLDFHRQGPTTTFIKNQQNNYDQTEPLEIKIVSTGVEMKTMEG